MHEVSLAQGIVDVVTRNAQRAGIVKVNDVRVAVGKLAGVDIRALRFAWESVKKDTACESATLTITEPEGRAWCLDCAKEVALANYGEACPICGGYHLAPTGGTELKVTDFGGVDDSPDEPSLK